MKKEVRKKVQKELFFEIILFAVAIIIISLLYKNNLLTLFLLIVLWIIAINLWHKKHDIYFYIIGAIIGTIGEIICVYFGVWRYKNPSLLGVPIWVPFAWGFAIILAKRIAETFVKIEFR